MGLINLDFGGFIAGLGEIAMGVIGLILAPFQLVWNLIRGGFGLLGIDIGQIISDAADGITQHLRNLIGTLRNIWNSIDVSVPKFEMSWAGVSFDLYNIDQAVADFMRIPANGKIGIPAGSFKLWDGIGDLFPDIGGSGRPQQMGMYAGGLWDVPRDMPAFVHQGESIVPADFARRLRGEGGMGGNTYHITVNVPPTANLADVGREITRALKAFGQGGGQASMRAAIGVR
jgi:hypothetical protein